MSWTNSAGKPKDRLNKRKTENVMLMKNLQYRLSDVPPLA